MRAASLAIAALLTVAAAPAAAQVDLVGEWGALNQVSEDQPHRAPGADLGDYTGLPINDAARLKARSWDASVLSQPERQAQPHPVQYAYRGGGGPNLRIEKVLDPYTSQLIAYTFTGYFGRADRTIWMDGRPHPSKYAPHTWAGFTTGQWQGSTLVTRTTHIKWGWIRRNGVATSDQAEVVTYYTRNENVLTVTWIVYDPLYLSEPFIRSSDFIAAPRGVTAAAFGVEPADRGNNIFAQCLAREEIARPDLHYVPHYLEGTNPFVGEHAKKLGVPVEATLGGAETALPEYKDRLKR